MTTLRPFSVDDLFEFNNVNLDPLTETYSRSFYLGYLSKWPEYFQSLEAPDGRLMGYVMGKVEGEDEEWHGHVTAVTIAPEYRRLGLARKLMQHLEGVSESVHNAYFVDLFVRMSNASAIGMYEHLGYSVYRQVISYYSRTDKQPAEDAYDMRKALPRDVDKKSIVPLPNPVYIE